MLPSSIPQQQLQLLRSVSAEVWQLLVRLALSEKLSVLVKTIAVSQQRSWPVAQLWNPMVPQTHLLPLQRQMLCEWQQTGSPSSPLSCPRQGRSRDVSVSL